VEPVSLTMYAAKSSVAMVTEMIVMAVHMGAFFMM
jgi:hypothetical protein